MTEQTTGVALGTSDAGVFSDATAEGVATAPGTVEAKPGKPRSLWSDAWHDLRRRPVFFASMILILFLLVMAVFPGLFTSVDPTHQDLSHTREAPSASAWFGYDVQGRDIYARVVYGARWSILVGVCSSLLVVLVGGTFGILAGYLGGWLDNLASRFSEIFFGLPFVLGAIVILSAFRSAGVTSAFAIVTAVVLSFGILAWPVCMRITRAAAISAKQHDYVKAARALGASTPRVIFKHLLPNCLAPVLVYATIALGEFIGIEATLSFLGVGLRAPAVSWGVMISDSRDYIRIAPHLLMFPAGFLVIAVLSFVMLGDAIRDALDPKLR
jgi:oligopeptide transport system permease protein